jgi:hypothetical protein
MNERDKSALNRRLNERMPEQHSSLESHTPRGSKRVGLNSKIAAIVFGTLAGLIIGYGGAEVITSGLSKIAPILPELMKTDIIVAGSVLGGLAGGAAGLKLSNS